MNIMKISTNFALLTLLALVSYSLQAPVQSEESTAATATTAPTTATTAPTTAATTATTATTTPTAATTATTVSTTATSTTSEHTVTIEQESTVATTATHPPTTITGQDSTSAPPTTTTDDEVVAIPLTSCPGYKQGNPALRNRTGCLTGSILEGVDHQMAFGFHGGSNPDWSACDLPLIPEEKLVHLK